MKKLSLLFVLILSLLFTGCRTTKMTTVPINNDSVFIVNNSDSTCIRLKDSTLIRLKDSLVISYKDSTIYTEIPVERYVDIVRPMDTLFLETGVAFSKAYFDTTLNVLRGEISNKSDAVLEKTVYLPSKDHIIYKDSIRTLYKDSIKTIYRDSTKNITREIPVEVQIETIKTKYPKLFWWLLVYTICSLFGVGCYIYIKVKK